MMVQSPLELYTTFLGFKYYDLIWTVCSRFGIAYLPFLMLMVNSLTKPFETAIGNGADISFRRTFIEFILMTLVCYLAVAPAYPNPSNPETWIPFALSRRADVAVALFDTRGFLVRSIEVGPREAGDHHHRGSAVHWDGRNGAGDRVSGGLYIARVTATPTSGGAPVIEHARVLLAR